MRGNRHCGRLARPSERCFQVSTWLSSMNGRSRHSGMSHRVGGLFLAFLDFLKVDDVAFGGPCLMTWFFILLFVMLKGCGNIYGDAVIYTSRVPALSRQPSTSQRIPRLLATFTVPKWNDPRMRLPTRQDTPKSRFGSFWISCFHYYDSVLRHSDPSLRISILCHRGE